MEALMYCCCGLDVHRDLIEACILRGEGLEPEIILSVSGRKLLNILRDTGSLTPLDVAENCRRLRRSPEEISAAVCGNLTVAEQRLLKQLLHKSIFLPVKNFVIGLASLQGMMNRPVK